MTRIGILCAGNRELAPFLPHMQGCKTSEKAMLRVHEGTIGGVSVAALFCGICKTNAAIAAQILIDGYHVDGIINAGTAGGMDGGVALLDTVVATETAHHDVEDGLLTAFHPWMPSVWFKSDETLLALAKTVSERVQTGRKIHFGRMVTGEKFITDEGRTEINAAFQPLSVDMETASIAHVCYVNRVPFLAARSITDTAAHSGEGNFEQNCGAASEISKDFVLALLAELKNHRGPTA